MGVFKKGINGPFSGKTGSIIGSKWKSIHYMKGLPRVKKNREASEDQLKQREKFKLLLDFFSPIHNLLAVGFRQSLGRQTAVNAAMKWNYDLALVEDEGRVYLDYSKVQFSHGVLFTPGAEQAKWIVDGIEISWNTKTYGIRGSMDDRVNIICFMEKENSMFLHNFVLRSDGKLVIPLKETLNTTVRHIWLFVSSAKGDQVSKTVYIPLEEKGEAEIKQND